MKLQTLHDSPCEKVTRVRDELGFTHFVMPYDSDPMDSTPIVARLAGTESRVAAVGGAALGEDLMAPLRC